MKVKKSSIDLGLLLLTLEEWPIIQHQVYIIIKYCILLYLLIKYIVPFYVEVRKNKSYIVSLILLMIFMVLSTLSTINYTKNLNWAISALMNGLSYIVYFEVLCSISIQNGFKNLIRAILLALMSVLVFTDILMVLLPYEFSNPSEQYLIGNKFTVSYYHCLLAVISKVYLYLYYGPNKKFYSIIYYISGILSIGISVIVHCSTGLIISVVSFLLLNINEKLRKVVCNRFLLFGLLFVENFAIFGPIQILTHPLVQLFVTNVLGKSANFTGRFKIFRALETIIEQKPLLGYGFNTATDVVTSVCGYGNAQNGVMQLLIQFGLIGTGVLFVSLYLVLGKTKKSNNDVFVLYVMLYALVIASTIEITLSSLFVFVIAIISAAKCYQNKIGNY